jgi:uncharacterized protein YlxW (UPF0749 family)
MKGRVSSAQLCLTAVCLVFGILLMVQFRTQGKIAKALTADSSADQAQIVSNLYDANLGLRKEVETLEDQVRQQQDEHGTARVSELMSDLQKFRIVNGTAPASGAGVELTIQADIRAEDLQDLINELRNAGAEAMALNGTRVTVRTAVASDRGAITLNGERLTAPYVFSAIGAPDTLERALTRKGGLISYLQNTYPEGKIDVVKQRAVLLPQAGSPAIFQIAQPVQKTG